MSSNRNDSGMALFARKWLLSMVLGTASIQASASCDPRTFTDDENQVIKAYVAYYGRAPDAAGLAWWADQLSVQDGSLAAIMESFGRSDEFTNNFGELENEALINNLYLQAFGRDADEAGLAWYQEEFESGRMSLQTIALQVLDGAINEDESTVGNRLIVSQYAVTLAEDAGFELSEAQLQSAINEVTSEDDSLTTACDAIAETVSEQQFDAQAVAEQSSVDETCDNGSTESEATTSVGFITGVSGMSYVSESEETLDGIKKTITGETSATGEYEYYEVCGEGSETTFCIGVKKSCETSETASGVSLVDGSVGGRVLGQIESSEAYLTIEDIVAQTYPNTSESNRGIVKANIYQLLVSLDEDGDESNGISMTPRIRAEAEKLASKIDFTDADFDQNENVLQLVKRASKLDALPSEELALVFEERLPDLQGVTAKQEVFTVLLAYLGRPTDPDQNALWKDRLNESPGNFALLIDALGKADEYQAFVENLAGDALVDGLSARLFNRPAREEEKAYWLERFEAGSVSSSTLPAEMAKAPYRGPQDRQAMNNKLLAFDLFYQHWGDREFDGSINDTLVDIIAHVDGRPESLAMATTRIDEL